MVSSGRSRYCPASRSPRRAPWKEPQPDVGGESRAAPDPGALSNATRERLGDGSPVVPLRSRARVRVCAQERVLRRAVDDRPAVPTRCSGEEGRVQPEPCGSSPETPARGNPRGQPRGSRLQSKGPFYKTLHVPAAGSALQTTGSSRTTLHLRALCTDGHTPPRGRSPGGLSVPNRVYVGHCLRCLDPRGVTAAGPVCYTAEMPGRGGAAAAPAPARETSAFSRGQRGCPGPGRAA